MLLGGITSCSVSDSIPPIPTHFSVVRSVCLSSVVFLSHSCTLLKPFDGFRCHLAGTLVHINYGSLRLLHRLYLALY